MADFSSYCQAVVGGKLSQLHRDYHDHEYGFPAHSDQELFGRMLLEINQAGLSWNTILNKRHTIKKAYANFDLKQVAAFDENDIQRLLQDPGIIRMKLKIQAAIHNARQIQGLQAEYGSFAQWLDHHHPRTREQWTHLFKKTFRFMGPEITKEFLMGTGYLKGAHDPDCPIYARTIAQNPPWRLASSNS